MAYLTGVTKGPKSYATLQCGPRSGDHVLLNSDLSYGVHGPEMLLNTVRLIDRSCARSPVFHCVLITTSQSLV